MSGKGGEAKCGVFISKREIVQLRLLEVPKHSPGEWPR